MSVAFQNRVESTAIGRPRRNLEICELGGMQEVGGKRAERAGFMMASANRNNYCRSLHPDRPA